MQVSQWTGQNGETRQGWQVIADSVISARAARPAGTDAKPQAHRVISHQREAMTLTVMIFRSEG